MTVNIPSEKDLARIEGLLSKDDSLNDLHTKLHNIGFHVGYSRLAHLYQQKKQITVSDILNCIVNPNTKAPNILRQPTPENEKHANRRDTLEIRHPEIKQNNWRENYDDPSIVFSSAESRGDIESADMMAEDARVSYESSGNMLYLLEAFFQRVDWLAGRLSEVYVQQVNHEALSKEEQPQDVPCELHDGGGLYLLVFSDGTKEWHLEYHLAGETRDHHFGNYPDRTLSYARRYSNAAHDLLRNGKDPSCLEHENELQARIDCIYDKVPDVPIPAWIAHALADGFKQYYSRRYFHKQNVSLDSVLGIESKKNQEEMDFFTVDTRTFVEKVRELQWYFGLSFATCCKIAEQLLRVEMTGSEDLPDGEKNHLYHFNHATLQTVCEQEARGAYGSFAGWCERHSREPYVNELCKKAYLDYLATLDTSLKTLVEKSLHDERKQLKM